LESSSSCCFDGGSSDEIPSSLPTFEGSRTRRKSDLGEPFAVEVEVEAVEAKSIRTF
jgi:hypothetical protein